MRRWLMGLATVGDYMTVDVVVLRPDDGFKQIVRALAERGVSGAPVVDETGGVMGVVSEADLLHKEAFTTVAEEPRRYFESRRLHAVRAKAVGDTAADMMSAPAVTVVMDTPIAKAARLMAVHGIKRLPVVGDDGGLVGIISRADIMGVFLTPDHQIRDEVISEVIARSLWEDPARIHVEVTDGVVTLSGRLASKFLIPIAVALTRGVDGVVDVVDELSYARDGTVAEIPGDRR
jgi:CBS domain-containing protein